MSVLKADAFVWRALEEFAREGAAKMQAAELSEQYADAAADVERAEQELAAWTNGRLVSVIEEAFLAGFVERQRALDDARETVSILPPPSETLDLPLPDFDFAGLSREDRSRFVHILIESVEVSRGRGDGRLRIEWRPLF